MTIGRPFCPRDAHLAMKKIARHHFLNKKYESILFRNLKIMKFLIFED
jgi:hypothetical protein